MEVHTRYLYIRTLLYRPTPVMLNTFMDGTLARGPLHEGSESKVFDLEGTVVPRDQEVLQASSATSIDNKRTCEAHVRTIYRGCASDKSDSRDDEDKRSGAHNDSR